MRTRDELIKLLYELKDNFKKDFACEYTHGQVQGVLMEMREQRIFSFLRRRIAHLLDNDFLNFCQIFMEDVNGKIVYPPEEKQPEPKVEEVAIGKTKNRKQVKS